MIWYVFAIVIVAILIGAILVSSYFWNRGYDTAVCDIKQKTDHQLWMQLIEKIQGGSNDVQKQNQ